MYPAVDFLCHRSLRRTLHRSDYIMNNPCAGLLQGY